jgi:hypothetical protein
MASKAGRAQFKDIKTGRAFWVVLAGTTQRDQLHYGWAHEPERVEIVQKPFRTQIADIGGTRRDEWSFTVHYSDLWWNPNTVTTYDCSQWGIETDIPFKGVFGLRFMFTTQAHAIRYVDRVRNGRLQDIYEHPKQFTRLGFMSKPANRKRVQKAIRPYQFVVGGVVCDHTTPKAHVEYYMEQSRHELSQMYPHEIKRLNLPKVVDLRNQFTAPVDQGGLGSSSACAVTDAMVASWAADPKAFKQPDPTTFYPGAVFVPQKLSPGQRAVLEQDFVILDEAHQLDSDPRKFTKIIEEFKAAAGDVKGRNIVGYDPAGPTLTSIRIGNGDQITYAETFPKKDRS